MQENSQIVCKTVKSGTMINNFRDFKLWYTNSNGLRNKINELRIQAESDKYDVICVTETMFNSDILEPEISIQNYNVFRVDRSEGHGGGSCIYIRNTISAEHDTKFKLNDCLSTLITLDSFMITLICIYRSPSLSHDVNCNMIDYLNKYIASQPTDNIIILAGDFNLPDVDWDEGVVICPLNTTNKTLTTQQKFLDLFRLNGLHWMLDNTMYSRCRSVKDKLQTSHLDQILTTEPNIFKSTCLTPALGKSDHFGILNVFNFKTNTEMLNLNKRCWGKMKLSELASHGNYTDWNIVKDITGAEEILGRLNDELQKITKIVPKVKTKVTRNGNIIHREPFSTASLKKSRTKLNKLWHTYYTNPSLTNYNIAKETNQDYDKKLKKCLIEYEKKITAQLKTNPKVFYSYLASKRKVKNVISGLKNHNDELLTTAEDIANELGNFFHSTFTTEPDGLIPIINTSTTDMIEDLYITASQVKEVLNQVNHNKSPGPDEIHPKLLKALSNNDGFINAVTELFRSCYNTGKMPQIWKLANIVALHKKGDKMKSSNYRPISLTSTLCKCYEKILKKHVLEHFERHLCQEQHGFIGKRSCFSNLLECMHRAYEILDEKENLDILYMDFMKAFDSVPHKRLISKLKSYGIKGKTLKTIEDFLSNRKFRVRIGEKHSKLFDVLSGVPQGSVLGPLLFIIYINDLPGGIQSFVSLFADDLKILTKTGNHDMAQEDLNYLTIWQDTWLLKFNTKDNKCKVLHVGKTNPNHDYWINNAVLPKTETEKDLGVIVNEDLTWTTNIESAINKATSMIGWVARNVISREKMVMLNIYKSLIRPQLEYCVQLWNPHPKHGNWSTILKIEEVQRNFTRMIEGIGLKSYRERLEELSLTTLLERRVRGDLIECFKIYKGITNYGKDILNVSRSGYNLIMKAKNNSRLADFFPERAINYWNKLPDNIKDAEHVDSFKVRLETHRIKNIHTEDGNYWNLSNVIFQKIEKGERQTYVNFMLNNPGVASRKRINIR